MGKRILTGMLAVALTVTMCCGAAAENTAGEAVWTGGALSFEQVEPLLRTQGTNYLVLEETIRSIEVLDYEQMEDDIRDMMNMLSTLQWGVLQLGQLPGSDVDTYTFSTLGQSVSSLDDAYEDLREGDLQEDNHGVIRQLRDTQNQMVVSAQSLYVALLEMDSALKEMERTDAATARTAAEMQLRYERGQISAVQLAQVKNGQEQLNSAKTTLKRNIQVYTIQLQSLLGMELTGELTLTEVPEITGQEIGQMDHAADLAKAKQASYALYEAGEDLEQAEEDYHDEGHDYGYNEKRYQFLSAKHTYQAAQHTYETVIQNFEVQFFTAYTAVEQYQAALQAAESALELEELELATQEMKYQQGNLSENALLTARDELESAKAAVLTAKHDLFSAWLTYRQAVELGILN